MVQKQCVSALLMVWPFLNDPLFLGDIELNTVPGLSIIRVRNMTLWVIIAFCDPCNTLNSYLNKRTTGAL